MDFHNVWLLVQKDWRGIRKNKEIFASMIFLPLLFSIFMPLMMILAFLSDPSVPTGEVTFLLEVLMKPFFLLIPTMISAIVAADSFAGEKERKTVEALLVLPMTDRELIVGKILVGLIPSLLITTGCFVIYGIIANVLLVDVIGPVVFTEVAWYLIVALLCPALSFMAELITVLISAHTQNVKSAQSWSGAMVIPVMLLLFSALAGVFVFDIFPILVLSGVFAAIDGALLYVVGYALNREKLVAKID